MDADMVGHATGYWTDLVQWPHWLGAAVERSEAEHSSGGISFVERIFAVIRQSEMCSWREGRRGQQHLCAHTHHHNIDAHIPAGHAAHPSRL